MRIQKLAYVVCSLVLLLPGIADAERGRIEEHRSQRGMERNYQPAHGHVDHRHRSEVYRRPGPAHVEVHTGNPGRYVHEGRHYRYHNKGRYYNYYHNGNYYAYYHNGSYYNYFYNGAYYLYFINGAYYNYFYHGRYYKSCVKRPGSAVMVCR